MGIFSDILGLTKEQEDALTKTGAVNIRKFGKRQILSTPDDDREIIGILLSGTAFLDSANYDSQRRILDYYETGGIFGQKFVPNMDDGGYYVISGAKCQVAFLNLQNPVVRQFLHNAPTRFLDDGIMAMQRRSLTHIDILGQRSLRQKLLAFLTDLSRQKKSESFYMPFSFTDCADYLAVDRSAMMRELGKMKEQGLLETNGRKITLLAGR